MAHVRLLIGRFLKMDGLAIQDFEDLTVGAIESIPALTGTNGCSLGIGNFLERL